MAEIKNGNRTETTTVDKNSGEVLNIDIIQHRYMTKDTDEFYLVYSTIIQGLLSRSSDINVSLFAVLMRIGGRGETFAINGGLKEEIAYEIGCGVRSLDNSLTYLTNNSYLIRVRKGCYKINPRHVFQGSSKNRLSSMKALIELGYNV